ncbi:MAG: site-specific integrase [Bacteroidota bacterium]
MSIKVTLRQKPISGDRASLFLDFYPAITHPKTGKSTRREFLGMYIHSPIKFLKRKDKQLPVYDLDPVINETYELHNLNALKTAKQICQQRQDYLDKPEIYNGFEREQLRIKELCERSFLQYFKQLTDKRKASNHDNWASAYNYLKTFSNNSIRFADLNERYINEFKDYLLTTKSNKSSKVTLSRNSAASYFLKLKATLKQAYVDGYLQTDLNARIKPIKQEETQRNFLTLEELNSLAKKDCQNPILKNASLFSALTGLRFSDIEKLTWSEVEHIEGQGYFIQFTQKKTKGAEMMPIGYAD